MVPYVYGTMVVGAMASGELLRALCVLYSMLWNAHAGHAGHVGHSGHIGHAPDTPDMTGHLPQTVLSKTHRT